MKLSLLKQIHHFPECFKLRTSLWWKILPLTGLWGKNTRIRHWAAKHVGVMQSCCCQMQDMFLKHPTLQNARDTDPIGFFIVITNDCNFFGSFSDFVSKIDVYSPSHSQMIWRSSMISLFPLPTFPTWHQDHRPQPTSDCSASCIEDASICHSRAGWLELNRKMGTFSNPVPSMWQGDRLSKDSVSKIWGCFFANLMMFEPCSQNGAPGNTWSNFWIHPWKLTAGYPKWCFFSQFFISFQIWYLCQISGV